jgi:Transglycosylase SLT domain
MTKSRTKTVSTIVWFLSALVFSLALLAVGQSFARTTPQRAEIERMVAEEAVRAGIPVSLAMAVAKVESNFKPRALSSAGARGVMQIMPKTGKDLYGASPDQLWDARYNIQIGVDYLKNLHKRYGRWDWALSHYNGGSRVGTPPNAKVIPATRKYVDAVLAWHRRFERNETVIAMAEAIDSRPERPAARQLDPANEYWMFDEPAVLKDWRHYLKVADYWLGKKSAQDAAQNTDIGETDPALGDMDATVAEVYPVAPVGDDVYATATGRPSDDLKRRITARRLQFRDRLSSGAKPWTSNRGGRFGEYGFNG